MSSCIKRAATLLLAVWLQGCQPDAPVESTDKVSESTELGPANNPDKLAGLDPKSTPAPPIATVPEASKPFLAVDSALPPSLSPLGLTLIIEFEVGGRSGYNPHPEAPDARYSGVTWGIGYDAHQTSKAVILDDWKQLGPVPSRRLAATQPYYGVSAKQHLQDVRDILVSWGAANDVFQRIDVAREIARCRKAYDKFDELRPNAQAALISLGFNRGYSFIGDNRKEMRMIRDLVPKKDYAGMAGQFRGMVRVWKGTSIEQGMTRRRLAEAKLVETP